MTGEVAIRAEGLGKRYHLAVGGPRRDNLREVIADGFAAPFRKAWNVLRGEGGSTLDRAESFLALDDVSFEVRRGEVVGIVGHNGAGKTTLLKILSRITEPSAGRAVLRGRVGSLLEVGTGFHPELSGRENIFLNGAILGMRRAEIRERFDDIVAFAEVERFIDTPIKHYSSGMYLRLAFSVAAHLGTENLLVDEVLAVGDAEFQRRCLAKMNELSEGGRTILFVSHNLAAVRNICERGMLLERGRLVATDGVDAILDRYLAETGVEPNAEHRVETPGFVVRRVDVGSPRGPVVKTFDPLEIAVTLEARERIRDPGLYVGILGSEHQRLAGLDFKDLATTSPIEAGESVRLGFAVDELPLLPGHYRLELHVKDLASHRIEIVPATYPFTVVETPVFGGRKLGKWHGHLGLHARAFAERSAEQPSSPAPTPTTGALT